MTESLKVQPHHLERSAYLYIRQSSMRQVIEKSRALSGNMHFVGAQLPLAGATSKSSSSTTIRASPCIGCLARRVSNVWSAMSEWGEPVS